MSNDFHIRQAGRQDIPVLSGIIRRAFRDVTDRFALTPQNCPTHASNCTDSQVAGDMDEGVAYYLWYVRLGFRETETKAVAHLPFRVMLLRYELG